MSCALAHSSVLLEYGINLHTEKLVFCSWTPRSKAIIAYNRKYQASNEYRFLTLFSLTSRP